VVRRNDQSENLNVLDAFDGARSDYNASKRNRFRSQVTGVSAVGSGADYHYRNESDYLRMMELARSYDRNDIVVGQGVDRLINNVLQDGMKLDANTGDDDVNLHLKNKFDAWSNDPDVCHSARELTLHEMARMTLRHNAFDGDFFLLTIRDGTLETIEAHRVRTPRNTTLNVIHGVKVDPHRRPLEYWITKDDLNPLRSLQKVSDIHKIAARGDDGHRQVLHVKKIKRVSQTRGITWLAPIVDAVGMHDDLQFAQLVKAKVASCFAILEEYKNMDPPGAETRTGAQEIQTMSDGLQRVIEGVAPGVIYRGPRGAELKGFSPNVPNPEFFDHALLILTFIAINLHLPLAVLLLDPSKTNFSGWRGAMDQAREGFKELQKWMIAKFYRPIYLWKLRQWMVNDRELIALVAARGVTQAALMMHKFSPPAWRYIEPNKDAMADTQIIKGRLNSRRSQLAERGRDIDDVDLESIKDQEKLITLSIEAADRINRQYPDAMVDWREVGGFDLKGKLTAGASRNQRKTTTVENPA